MSCFILSAKDHLEPRLFYRAAPARRNEAENGPTSGEGESGPGVYMTNSIENARKYLPGYQSGHILEVSANVQNPLTRHPDIPNDPGEHEYTDMRRSIGYNRSDEWHAELSRRGYDAVEKHEPRSRNPYEIAIHPSKITGMRRLEFHLGTGE